MAPLRSADWRFLLPTAPDARFARLVLLGGPSGSRERAMSLGVADHVATDLPHDGTADAVVAHGDAPEVVGEIARAVGPGGVLYLEVDRGRPDRRTMTLSRTVRELGRAGLSVAAVYAVEPDLSEARAFVPVDSPAAVRWFRGAFLRAKAPIARLGGLARYSAISVAGRLGARLLRRFAVVAVRGGGAGAPPGLLRLPGITRTLGSTQRLASAVVTTHGGDRVIMFPFADRGSIPIATVKVPRSEPFFGRTENEQAQLTTLRAQVGAPMAEAIPRALGMVRTERVLAACEEFLPGQAVSSRAWSRLVRGRTKRDDLHCAMSWLVRFHQATEARRVPWNDDLRCALVDEPLRAYTSEFGATREETVLFSRARAAAAALSGVELPIVRQHRDFAVWNLLRDDERLAVLDWEGARDGPALGDALHLATTWLYVVRRGRDAAAEARCLDELFLATTARDAAAVEARRSINHYAEALRIDRHLVPLLLVHYRVELALRRRDGQRLRSEPWDPGDVIAEVRGVRTLAAGADRLFPSDGPVA